MTNKEAIEIIQEIVITEKGSCVQPTLTDKLWLDAMEAAIEALEQTEWILCSERLPGRYETVLLSVFDAKTENSIVETGNYDYIYKDFLIDAQMSDHRLCESETVLAWRPLPKPYRSEG